MAERESINITCWCIEQQQTVQVKERGVTAKVKFVVAGCSLVSVRRRGHICKMKGEAAVGCFHRGMERSGSGPSTNTRLIVQVQGNTERGFHSVSSASRPLASCCF